jgi:hypothetical protein
MGQGMTPPSCVVFSTKARRAAAGSWPRLYYEMCCVARQRLFRDWDYGDLAAHGISLALGNLSALQGAFFSTV